MLDLERVVQELNKDAEGPLHAHLSAAIRAQLMDGTLKPGETLPPERTLREQLDISRSTVRQAIKSLTNEGLLKSVMGAGTFVQEPQQAPPHNTLIGIIVPEFNYFIYYPELASSLSYRLRQAGYQVDLSVHNDRYETLAKVTSTLLAQDAKAVVVVVSNEHDADSETLRQLQAQGVTVMLLTRYLEHVDGVDYVGVDNHLIGVEATRHLLKLGHTNIVHVAATVTSTATDRAAGYIHAMQEAGLEPQMIIAPEQSLQLPAEQMKYLMADDPMQLWHRLVQKEVTAIFCFNDQIASWVQKEVRRFNLTIPRDFSLISVDNMPYADFFDTPLTTFALPGEEIGKQAADLLLRRLQGEAFPPQRILLPARLMHNLSTAAPPQKLTDIG